METKTSQTKKKTTKQVTNKKSSPKTTTKTAKTVASEKKQTPKQTTVKRTTVKKVPKPVEQEPKVIEKVVQEPVHEEPKTNLVECKNCHQVYMKDLTTCPHCHKKTTKNIGLLFFIVFACVFIAGILCFTFIEKFVFTSENTIEYKESCQLVDYENLVRHPKNYLNKKVKIYGTVTEVEGYDDGLYNNMEITLNVNQFSSEPQIVTIKYNNQYEQGFIKGDTITVYGLYSSINGNIPLIEAKYIVFGK